jgi:hypothetical protein
MNVFYLGNFPLYEPMTVITDLVLAIACFLFFKKLIGHTARTVSSNNWGFFFLFFALSTLLGALSHGLFQLHQGAYYLTFWLLMQTSSIVSLFFAQQATLYSLLQDSTYAVWWRRSFLVQLFLAVLAIIVFKNFGVVVISNALTFIPILILNLSNRSNASRFISLGILISFLTAIVHATKFSLHLFFNHNDIAHLLLTLSLLLVFVGVNRSLNKENKEVTSN